MAELHVIGQLVGATDFGTDGLFCKWGFHAGRAWELLEGLDAGQTQADFPEDGVTYSWSHPVDVHYASRGLAGWPKLCLQVWSQDQYGRNDIAGYGFCHVPTAPGSYELACPCWVPEGSFGERFSGFFLGGRPRLKLEEVVYTGGDRFRLQTLSTGQVHVRLNVIMKDFERNNVQY